MSAHDDDGFDGYLETTVDPGSTILVSTIILCGLLYCFLPWMVSFGNRYQKRKEEADRTLESLETENLARSLPQLDEETHSSPSRPQFLGINQLLTQNRVQNHQHDDMSVSTRSSVVSSFVDVVLNPAPLAAGGRHARLARLRARTRDLEKAAQTRKNAPTGHLNETIGAQSDTHSVLDKLDADEVSFRDAVDEEGHIELLPTSKATNGIDHAPRDFAWWRLASIANCFDHLLTIVEWDSETKQIWKLALPYITQAVLTGFAELARVAIIGKMIGTKEVSAYITVNLFLGLTNNFLGGFVGSLSTLCSQAVGNKNDVLAGQYIQLAFGFYTLFSLILMTMWSFLIDSTLEWLGFDEETVSAGVDYSLVYIFVGLCNGVNHGIHSLLDTMEYEGYSSIITVLRELSVTGVIFLAALFFDVRLQTVGFLDLGVSLGFLLLNILTIAWTGWFRQFYIGLFGTRALENFAAVKVLLRTSGSLAFGYLLSYSEWEILTVFARLLGPAEIVAWGLLGTVWSSLSYVTQATADAAEVRCAFLLGAGQPWNARLSAYKSALMGVISAMLTTGAIFVIAEDLPTWLTSDSTLQAMVGDLIPLFGMGNMALSFGTMTGTLVGSQGRYRLSTGVCLLGSWLVTIPLAAFFTAGLNIDLQGQTAAVVIGCMVSGTANCYFLLRSDWPNLSSKVLSESGSGTDKEDGDNHGEEDKEQSS
jgi:Na+-driven multidrug efflux pump